MSTIERITGLDAKTLEYISALNLLRANVIRDFLVYDYFTVEKQKYGTMQAITNTADKFYMSEDNVKKIIYQIKKIDNVE